MRPKTVTEKYHFTFSKDLSALFKRVVKETDLSQIRVIERAIQDFAEKKGIK